MTQEQKMNNMKIAARICGFGFDNKGEEEADRLVRKYYM